MADIFITGRGQQPARWSVYLTSRDLAELGAATTRNCQLSFLSWIKGDGFQK